MGNAHLGGLNIDVGLEIIPVVNKIDLPSAMVEQVKHQIIDLIGYKEEDIILTSAKMKSCNKINIKANIPIQNLPPNLMPNSPDQ